MLWLFLTLVIVIVLIVVVIWAHGLPEREKQRIQRRDYDDSPKWVPEWKLEAAQDWVAHGKEGETLSECTKRLKKQRYAESFRLDWETEGKDGETFSAYMSRNQREKHLEETIAAHEHYNKWQDSRE